MGPEVGIIMEIMRLLIRSSCTLRETMEIISSATRAGLPGGIALVVHPDGTLAGVVTDGDLRRALLAGHTLDDVVEPIVVKDPIVFLSTQSYREILNEIPHRLREKGRYRGGVLEKVIVVDREHRVTEVMDFLDLWRRQVAIHRRVCVVGLGFVGLTLAVSLADVGYEVVGVDSDPDLRDLVAAGRPHFHEVGLEPLLKHHLDRRLRVEEKPPADCEIYIIAVGTPLDDVHEPDLDHLRHASKEVGAVLGYGDLVVLRSTVPLGTCRGEVLPVLEKASGLKGGSDFYLSFAPERTIEGKALAELRALPQIVGGLNQNSTDLTVSLFREMSPSLVTTESLEEAEMVKLLNNSFRDLSFAFANEFALMCEAFNLNAARIIQAANKGYPRDRIPSPSPGVGGYCLKKDPYIFAQAARRAGIPTSLSEHGRRVNETMPGLVVRKVEKALGALRKSLRGARVFIIGFAFKGEPETSDMRHSTTLDILEPLQALGADVAGYDPVVPADAIRRLGVRSAGLEEGFANADAVLMLNNHRSYASLDIYACLSTMNRPAVYCDTWNMFPPEEVKQVEGITYVGLGFTI